LEDKTKLFKIKIFVSDHNHAVGPDLFCHYASQRKPTDQEFTEMVKLQIKTGAKVATLINNYNDEHGKNLQVKDYHNYSQKLNQAIKLAKDELLEQLLDELKQNPNNTVETLKSREGVMESAFIMLDFQKEWLKLYPEILHLDGTYDTNSEKYVLHTFLSQVNIILFFTKIF
jgi:hypothetical protein